MREIKFRAFLKDENKMIYPTYNNGYYINYCEGEIDLFYGRDDFPIENTIVTQFTGLTDVNGVEIYEGDILKDGGEEGPVFVEWSEEHCGFIFVDPFDYKGREIYRADQICYEVFEIIGNIYENSDLLATV